MWTYRFPLNLLRYYVYNYISWLCTCVTRRVIEIQRFSYEVMGRVAKPFVSWIWIGQQQPQHNNNNNKYLGVVLLLPRHRNIACIGEKTYNVLRLSAVIHWRKTNLRNEIGLPMYVCIRSYTNSPKLQTKKRRSCTVHVHAQRLFQKYLLFALIGFWPWGNQIL